MVYRFILPLLLALPLSNTAHSEAGMIPMDSPPGEIGGRGHWYSLRTMKGSDYWEDPAINTSIKSNENGTYSIAGEAPISLALVLHPDWYPNEEPWRQAINWIREAEQIFRNSGVPIRFIIEDISVWEDMPDTKEAAYHSMTPRTDIHADMTVGLMPHYSFDPYCGIASLGKYNYYGGSIRSVSGCSVFTLAHELGHNFGLLHDFKDADSGERGYCIRGNSGDFDSCNKGTIMAYAASRVPFFSNKNFTYDDRPLGDESHDAVTWLREVSAGRGLAWELDQQRDPAATPLEEETAYCE